MRVVFLGTDEIGEIALRSVTKSSHKVVLIVTPPDRPKGRGRSVEPGVVKATAAELGIPVIQPETIRDAAARKGVSDASPDVIAVVSYGEYIPSSISDLPPYKSINVHPSLLPRWRGAAPVRYALMAGDDITGVSVQYVHKRMDAGDILLQEEIRIDPEDDHGSLCGKLYPLGAQLLVRALDGLEAHAIPARPQDESRVTQAPKIEKEDLWLQWDRPANEIRNRVRAFAPTPGARTRFRDADYKILGVRVAGDEGGTGEPGMIAQLSDNGPVVVCRGGCVEIVHLQPPGKKAMSGRDFMNGYRIKPGELFSGIDGGGNT